MADSKSKGVSNEELIEVNRRWVEEKKEELRKREDEISKLQGECARIRQELDPIEIWLARMEHREVSPTTRIDKGDEVAGEQRCEEVRGDRLRDEVVLLLREVYPNMMYYRVILSRLQQRGYEVGGKDPGLNLIAHISKDKRIKRGDKRGIYGLDENFFNAGEPGAEIPE